MSDATADAPRALARARRWIGIQIALSVPFQIVTVQVLRRVFSTWIPTSDALSDRMLLALRGALVGGATLLAMIAFIAGARPLWAETIGGAPDAAQLERHVRAQRNTLEQLVVMCIAHFSLAATLPHDDLSLLPALTALFVVARILYWIGYVRDPMHRTFGFVATFYPNLFAMGLALWQVFFAR